MDEITFTLMIQSGLASTVALFKVIEAPPGVASREAEAPQFCRAFAGRGGSATTRFSGRLSVREVCVRERNGSVLLIVILNTLGSSTNTVLGDKDLLTEGEFTPITVNVALDGVVFVIEAPPPVELKAFAGIVLIRLPRVVEVTSIVTVQSPGTALTCAGTVPPLRDSVVVPGTAVTLPPHELVTFAGFAMASPGWTPTKLSVQEALFSWKEFGL